MNLRSPVAWLGDHQKTALIVLLIGTIVLGGVLQVLGASLMNDTAPYGIISYEFAGDVASATRILESWGVQGRLVAGLHIGLDYSFLIFYSLAIALGCTLVAQASRMISLRKFGYPLAWLQLTAAILDALENYGLIRILLGSDSQFWAILAFWCASVKFLFVGLGILYVILGSFLSRLPVRTD